MQKITVVIPTYNSIPFLQNCLESIKWADEIIIVDMGSTDDTINLAKRYNTKIYHRIPKDTNFDSNRKFGMLKANGEWIMKLDSDEVLSKTLQEEIKKLVLQKADSGYDGYNFYNRLFWFNQQIKHGCARPNSHELRLVKKGRWQYDPYCFHQGIKVQGKVGFLKGTYDHFNYRSVNEFFKKTNLYTSFDAEILSKSQKYGLFRSIFFPYATFVRLYFFQEGYLDGRIGFISSFLFAVYNSILKVKVWEYQSN